MLYHPAYAYSEILSNIMTGRPSISYSFLKKYEELFTYFYVRTRRHSTSRHNMLPRTTLLAERRTWNHHHRHSHYHNDMLAYYRDGNYEYVTVLIFCKLCT